MADYHKGKTGCPGTPFPLALTVTVDTSSLRRGKTYSNWINIMMDNSVTRVAVFVHVPFIYSLAHISARLSTLLLIVGFFLGTSASHALFFALPDLYQNPLLLSSSRSPAVQSQQETARTSSINQESILAFVLQEKASTNTSTSILSATMLNIVMPSSQPSTTPTEASSPSPTIPFNKSTILSTTQPTNLPPATETQTQVNTLPQLTQVLMIVPDTYSINAHATTSTDAAILEQLPSGTIAPATGRTNN